MLILSTLILLMSLSSKTGVEARYDYDYSMIKEHPHANLLRGEQQQNGLISNKFKKQEVNNNLV